jgi:hypothetical protein
MAGCVLNYELRTLCIVTLMTLWCVEIFDVLAVLLGCYAVQPWTTWRWTLRHLGRILWNAGQQVTNRHSRISQKTWILSVWHNLNTLSVLCDVAPKSSEGDHLEDPGVDGRIILKWTCERLDGGAWTGSIWLRIGTGGELLWMRLWTFGFHKIREISWVAQDVLASQEGLCSME